MTKTKKQTPAKLKGAARKAQLTAEAAVADIKLAGPELTADMFEQAEATAADIKLVPGPELMEAMEAEQAAAVAEAVEAEPDAVVVEVPAPQVDAMKATKTIAKAAKAPKATATPKAETTKAPRRTVQIVEQEGHWAIVIVNPRAGAETDRPPWTHKTRKACETDCARNNWAVQ